MGKKKKLKAKKNFSSSKKRTLEAPSDLCLLGDNIKDVLVFFREIRAKDNWYKKSNGRFKVEVSLKRVEKIDYAAISVLTALSENLKKDKIEFGLINSDNRLVKKMLFYSGMLNHFYDESGKKVNVSVRGELINLKDGCGILKVCEIRAVTESLKRVIEKIDYPEHQRISLLRMLRRVIMEICGNAVEWGYGRKDKKWILGIYKEQNQEFIVTFTDIGDGILKTLNRKTQDVIMDLLQFNKSIDILMRAFEKKYGSSTREPNRNRGLPMIKQKLMQIEGSNLVVLTNDALVNFSNLKESKDLKELHAHFHGTFYQWSIKNNGNQSV